MADSDTLQQDVALFTSVVDSKRNALGVTTQQKKNTLGLPDLGEVRAIPEFNFEGSSIPSLEDSEREYQKSRSYYNLKNDTALFSENAFEKGVKYFGNIAGAGIAGVGHLDNLVLSAPNIVSNLLAPADKALGQFVADTVPSFNRAVAPVFNKFFGDPAKAALQGADELGDLIQEGTGYFYNDRNVQKLSQQLTDNYNDNTGIADVVVNMAGTVGSNIHALPEVIANSYPIMMAMAAKGSILASTFIGSMGERMEQSITVYKDSHDGQLPTGNAYNTILVANAVGTAVELIESRFLLGKKIKLKQALAEKSGRLGTAISKVPFVNTGAALGTGTIAESGEEFTAEYLSKASGLQDKLTGLLDDRVVGPSAVNAAIGAGAGGAIKTAHSVPSDTGKLAKSGIDATAKFVERKIAVNTEKRKKSAAEAEDFLELAEINLEKDLTTFSNAEDRMAHIKETLVNLSKANNQRESLDGKEAEEADARILEMQKKLKAVITIHSELKAVEESATTVAEAEKRIVSAVEDTVDSRDAINTVVSAIDEGRDVTSNIVKTIRGSTIFSDLPKATQEKIELQDEFNDINITRPIGEKSLAEVAADIATGSTKEKFIGLSQHRQNVTLAIAAEDYKAAKLTLQQLKGLRDRINEKLSSRSTQPNQPSYATGSHSPGFIKQLSQEIKDLSTAMRLFDSNVKEKFGESPLTEADLRTPDIKPYKGDTSKSKPVTEAKEPAKDIEKPTTVKPKVTLASVKSQTVERIKKIKNTATKNILLVEVNKVKGEATKSNIKTLRDIYNRANEAIKVEGDSSTKTEVKEKGKQKTAAPTESTGNAKPVAAEKTTLSKTDTVRSTKVKEETKTKKDEVIKPRQTDLGLTGENPEKIKAFDSKGKIDTQILKLKKELSLLEQQLTDISKLINKTLKDNINVQQFLQSIGGLNRKDWSVTDVDKSFFKLKIGGSKPLFPVSGGKTVNEIREEFNSESYKNNSDWTDAEVVEEVLTILNGEVELLDPNAQAEIINLYEGQNEVSEEIDKVTANIVDLKTQRAAIDTEVKEETEAENDSSTKTKEENETVKELGLKKQTIFPTSHVQNIVYHSTDLDPEKLVIQSRRSNKVNDENNRIWVGAKSADKIGFYLSQNVEYSRVFGKNLIEFAVNIKNPYLVKDDDTIQITSITKKQRDELIAQGYDGLLYEDPEFRFEEIVVFHANQVQRIKEIHKEDSSTKTVPSVAKKESKEVKQKVVKDTETTAKPVKTVFIPVPAFNAILDMEIPDPKEYDGFKKEEILLDAKPHKAAVRTYKDMIIKQDDILRALQTMIRECNV